MKTAARMLSVLVVVSLAAAAAAAAAAGPAGPAGPAGARPLQDEAPACSIAPGALRCESLDNPLGIDAKAPHLSWILESVEREGRDLRQTAYRVLVADDPALLAGGEGNLWDTGKVESDQSVHVEYAGRPLRSRERAWWTVQVWDQVDAASAWSEAATWSMGLLAPADWEAKWIGDPTPAPQGFDPLPAPYLRKAFELDGGVVVRRATAYATALGLYELRINGRRVGDRLLAPESTDYEKRVQYQTYDVTDLVSAGDNAIGVILGDGWYAGRIGLAGIVPNGPPRAIYGRLPRLLLQVEIEFENDERIVVASDGTWRSTLEGPIRSADLLDGETYDARREMPGWERAGFDDAAWTAVREYAPINAALAAQPNEPIRVFEERTPVAMTEPQPGVYVFDLGQNMSGWCRLTAGGPAGATVRLRHAEALQPDGTIYTANLRSARQEDRYVLDGGETRVFEPRFTYHGFRYVEVTGLAETPTVDQLVGRAFCSSAPAAGSFERSDPRLEQLMRNIVWTQRGNMHGIPTDCPQRDERLGWTGDILAFSQAARFNLDMSAFFTKWLRDLRDAQTEDGRYPDFAPHPFDPEKRFSGPPAWADAGVFVPWCAYVNYGDARLLEEHYDSARRWVEFVRAKNPDGVWRHARGNDYGDWLNADTLKLDGWPTTGAEMPKEAFATAFYARSAELLSLMAAVIGRDEDAKEYASLAETVREAFNKTHVSSGGRVIGDAQGGCALALHFDLLPPEVRQQTSNRMFNALERYDGHLATGFHTTVPMMRELTRRGRDDLAYGVINERAFPSWGYAIDQGATTIWERWDGWVEGRGFQDPGMNSLSHYALGSVGEWMYRTIIGINPDLEQPGYAHVWIRPRLGGGLTWARGALRTVRGTVESEWRRHGEVLVLRVKVPVGATATVDVPTASPASVREGGRFAAGARGVRFIGARGNAAVYRIGSGEYVFEAGIPPDM